MNSEMIAIKNAKVVLEQGIIWDGIILINDNIITAVGKSSDVEIPDGARVVDANGAYVGPGLVDIHNHGGNGFDFDTSPCEAAEFFLKHGETSIYIAPSGCATLELEGILDNIRVMKQGCDTAPNIRGIYMEGPYFNSNYGCNKRLNKWGERAIVPEDYKPMVDACGDYVKVWMIAPERKDIKPFLEYARRVNPDVLFAVGHSEALPEEIRSLGKYRPTIQTHSMNATGRLAAPGGTRDFGPDEYCFKEIDVYCELISDSIGIHVNKEMQQLLMHVKGYQRIVLITDSTSFNNPTPEKFAGVTDINFDKWGGIAGSKLTLDVACRNVMSHTGCGIAQAFCMASTNPAKVIGIYDERGSVAVGKIADLVFVDDMFNVKGVMLDGEMVV